MHGVGMKPRKSKITSNSWRLLAVNCSANCWAAFGCSVPSSAKTVLTTGVTAFHWGPVEKLFKNLP